MISAQFNLGFSLALRLVEGSNALPLYMSSERWSDPTLLKLAGRVVIEPKTYDPRESELGADVTLELRDGRRLLRRQPTFRGQAVDPASPSDIEAKFRELVAGVLLDDRADAIVHTVNHLGELADITELVDLLQA
jgi:2-methylcitrate dehydratase PrpD